MKKIALIVLYFGEIPTYSKIFFNSLKYNPTIDLLLFTDQTVRYDGNNLKVFKLSFEELVNKIQKCFDFRIICEKPYKLCDYRPAYGYIFKEELKEYDFWGHCDLDIVLGDVRKFLREDILDKYEKIYQHGHMCFYKNDDKNNLRFKVELGMNYRDVFTTPVNCVFDEVEGIQTKYDLLGVPTYKNRDCADISPWHDSFQRVESYLTNKCDGFNSEHQVFYWEEGKLYRAYMKKETILQDEFNYLHFQRRNMPFNDKDIEGNSFYITRNGIVRKEKSDFPTIERIDELNKTRLVAELGKKVEYIQYIWKRRLNKYLFNR